MSKENKLEKYRADKIALLALLVLGLLLARLIVAERYYGPVRDGQKLLASMRQTGLDKLLELYGWENYFLVKNQRGILAGFYVQLFSRASDTNDGIEAGSALHLEDPLIQQFASFAGDAKMQNLELETIYAGAAAPVGTQVVVAGDDVKVTSLAEPENEQVHELREPALCDYLLDMAIGELFNSDYDEVIVNSVSSDGTLGQIAMKMQRIRQKNGASVKGICNVDFLDERGIAQQYFLDSQGRVLRFIHQAQLVYIFERSSAEKIIEAIGPFAESILKHPDLLK